MAWPSHGCIDIAEMTGKLAEIVRSFGYTKQESYYYAHEKNTVSVQSEWNLVSDIVNLPNDGSFNYRQAWERLDKAWMVFVELSFDLNKLMIEVLAA